MADDGREGDAEYLRSFGRRATRHRSGSHFTLSIPERCAIVKRRAIGTPYRRRIGTPCSSPWISGEARSHQPAQRVAAG